MVKNRIIRQVFRRGMRGRRRRGRSGRPAATPSAVDDPELASSETPRVTTETIIGRASGKLEASLPQWRSLIHTAAPRGRSGAERRDAADWSLGRTLWRSPLVTPGVVLSPVCMRCRCGPSPRPVDR